MFKFSPITNEKVANILAPLLSLLHEKLGIHPNIITGSSFIIGLISVPFILTKHLGVGLIFILVSLLLDGLDGPIARKYGYNLDFGEKLDTILDRFLETAIFLSFAITGYAHFKIVILSLMSIFLMTLLRNKTKFDPGFKRAVLFLGYLTNFHFAFQIIFFVNLFGFIVNLLILDFENQELINPT